MKIKKILILLSFIPFYVFSAPDTIELYGNKNPNQNKHSQKKEITISNENNSDVIDIKQKEIIAPSEVFEIKGGKYGKEDLQKLKEALKPKIENNDSIDLVKETKKKSKFKEKPPELPFLPNFVDIDNSPIKKSSSNDNKNPIDLNIGERGEYVDEGLISYKGSSTYKNSKNESSSSYINSNLLKKMQNLYDQLTNLGLPMKVYIVNDNNPVVKNFIKKNILKKIDYDYREGFISELSISAKINNSKIPVCYIYPKENISSEYNNFLKSLYAEAYKGNITEDQIVKFLLGKELSYCLDSLERENFIKNNKLIYSKESYRLGINHNVFESVFPYGMRDDEYAPRKFFKNDVQLIYQNMVADAFGFLLSYNGKYENNHFISLYFNNKYIKNSKYHKKIEKEIKNVINKKDAFKNKRISDLWKMARNIQINNINK